MIINGESRCIKCMSVLINKDKCSECGCVQSEYIPASRCLRAGTVLADKYTVGSVIGEGSFGITYLGWDNLLEIKVAIKEYFPSEMAERNTLNCGSSNVYVFPDVNEEYGFAMDKFFKEAKLLAHFNEYKGIVSVRDFFNANNTAYMVLEYIDGERLSSIIDKTEHFEADYVLELMRTLLETLQRIHAKGLVHRDISPDNIIMNKNKELVLIDFGSVCMRNIRSEMGQEVSFNPGFSPEEQYREDGIQGAYSDIYAICALMYFMITGEIPVESAHRLICDKLKPVRDYDINIALRQKNAIDKGMALNAKDRYQTVGELMNDLYYEEEVYTSKRMLYKILNVMGIISVIAVCIITYVLKKMEIFFAMITVILLLRH